MTVEENKQLIRRFFEEVMNQGNLDVADELFSPDFVFHNFARPLPAGPESAKITAMDLRNGVPDVHQTLEDVIAEGDRVVVRARYTGTHLGPMGGLPASGKRLDASAIHIFRIADGKIAERWTARFSPTPREQILSPSE